MCVMMYVLRILQKRGSCGQYRQLLSGWVYGDIHYESMKVSSFALLLRPKALCTSTKGPVVAGSRQNSHCSQPAVSLQSFHLLLLPPFSYRAVQGLCCSCPDCYCWKKLGKYLTGCRFHHYLKKISKS